MAASDELHDRLRALELGQQWIIEVMLVNIATKEDMVRDHIRDAALITLGGMVASILLLCVLTLALGMPLASRASLIVCASVAVHVLLTGGLFAWVQWAQADA